MSTLFEFGEDLSSGDPGTDGASRKTMTRTGRRRPPGAHRSIFHRHAHRRQPEHHPPPRPAAPAVQLTPLFVAHPADARMTGCNFDAGPPMTMAPALSRCRAWTALANGTDVDGDGVCDADEIPGCTDLSAANYNSAATDDDSCPTPGAPMPMPRTSTSGPTSTMAPAPCWGLHVPPTSTRTASQRRRTSSKSWPNTAIPASEGQTSMTSSPVTANTRSLAEGVMAYMPVNAP